MASGSRPSHSLLPHTPLSFEGSTVKRQRLSSKWSNNRLWGKALSGYGEPADQMAFPALGPTIEPYPRISLCSGNPSGSALGPSGRQARRGSSRGCHQRSSNYGGEMGARSGLVPSGAWLARTCMQQVALTEGMCEAAQQQSASPVGPAGRGAGAARTADTAPGPAAASRSTTYVGPVWDTI